MKVERIETVEDLLRYDPNFIKRKNLLFDSRRFLRWVSNNWDKIPLIDNPVPNLWVINKTGRQGNLVAKWDDTNFIVLYEGTKSPLDDILSLSKLRNISTVRETWAIYVTNIYPRPGDIKD